jgi:hypothetical protein
MHDQFDRKWITEHALQVLETYNGTPITVRQLYYRLVALGMTNSLNHYKRLVSAMTDARWDGNVDFDAFVDRERSAFGETAAEPTNLDAQIDRATTQLQAWATSYHLNRWENQPYFPIVGIEKKALQGVFEAPCEELDVGLYPMKGYPSLTFLNEIADILNEAADRGKAPVILYFGDLDPSGSDIPRAIEDNLSRMGCNVEVKRIALTPEQVTELGLPGVPPKTEDTRTATWTGTECVELDAVDPDLLQDMAREAIEEYLDSALYQQLLDREKEERTEYRLQMANKAAELFSPRGE